MIINDKDKEREDERDLREIGEAMDTKLHQSVSFSIGIKQLGLL